MSATQHSQPDLFSQAPLSSSSRTATQPSLSMMMRGKEPAILLVICFIVTIAAAYSTGYEQGRRLARRTQERSLDTVAVPPTGASGQSVQESTVEAAGVRTMKVSDRPKTQGVPGGVSRPIALPFRATDAYTIQLASYKSRVSAEREFAALKKKGFSPLILTRGEYLVLCVGNFSKKQAARTVQAELEKRYQGCYIRRI